MTYKKALNIIALQIQAMQGNTDSAPSVATMQQALKALKQFEWAVEVEFAKNHNGCWDWRNVRTKKIVELFDFKLYAIPKE